MEPKVDIWMPLSIGDYLADTSHLDTTEHGAYLLMLMHYWRKGPLPNDPTQLANIAKLPKDAWSIHEAVLMQFFTLSQDGMLHQKRSDQEKEKWMKTRATAQLKAAKAARSRWNGASSIAQAKPMQCPLPSPSPLPSPTPKPSLPEVAKNATSSSNDEAQVRSTSATRSDGAPSDTSGIVQTVDSGTSANGPETPALLFDEAVTTRENSQNRAIREVFTYYLAIIGREPGTYTFSALRRKKGLARLGRKFNRSACRLQSINKNAFNF